MDDRYELQWEVALRPALLFHRRRGRSVRVAERALKAGIDQAAWASLWSTKSRPFPKPETGKIAIKVINHYGEEVLRIYEVWGAYWSIQRCRISIELSSRSLIS